MSQTDRVQMEPSWKSHLQSEFEKPYMGDLREFLKRERDAKKQIFPRGPEYFAALNACPFEKVKVVILGQDPYHGPGQAHGLCFSVRPGVDVPPSLVNIYKELKNDLGIEPAQHGYLQSWAEQGVLLLNATLSVEAGRAGSHQNKGWEPFTDAVIDHLNRERSGLAFVLWGNYAQKKGAFIDSAKHLVLKGPHPSPLSAHRGFFGCKHFSKINAYLKSRGEAPIDWRLPAVSTRSGYMRGLVMAMVLAASFAARAADKTFVYCSEASPSTFNPQLADDGPTFNAASNTIYNRLVDFQAQTTKVIPSLAEKWEISKDGKTYTFHLRKNAQFQATEAFKPTRALNADDVVFSFERALKADHPYHKVGGGNYLYFVGMELDKIIAKVERVDDFTVRFTLTRPEAPFLADLAMSFAVVLSKEYGDQLMKAGTPEKIDSEPVGTGPFILKRYVKDNSIRFEAHPNYWAGRAKLDKLVFAITPEASVRYQKLKAGECNLIAEPAPQDLEGITATKSLKLMKQAGANVGYLAFNVQKPPFDKLEVRQALTLAMNRDYYMQVVYQGTAIPARGPLPPTVWGSDQKLKPYDFNIDKAKALLTKAGYPNGFTTELWTLPVARPYNPNGKKMGELMQADLAKIGVTVKLVTYDWSTYLAKARKGEQSMIQLGWTTDNGDPDNFMGTLLSCAAIEGGGNMARWCDKSYDQIILKAKTVSDVKARTIQYVKAQEMFRAQAPWATIAHATVFRGLTKNVTGYEISPLGVENFYPVDLN